MRVGKTWRSRRGGAWMAEPCGLETEGGAAKNESKKVPRKRKRSRKG